MTGVGDFEELHGWLQLAHARHDFRRKEVALRAFEFEDGAVDLRHFSQSRGTSFLPKLPLIQNISGSCLATYLPA